MVILKDVCIGIVMYLMYKLNGFEGVALYSLWFCIVFLVHIERMIKGNQNDKNKKQ